MVGGQNRIMAKVIILLLFGACKCLCGGERERERERENKNPCSDTQFKFQLSILFYFISLFSVFPFPPFSPPVLVVANRFPFVELFSHILHQLWVRSVPSTTLFIYLFICCWAFFASGSISLACWWGPA